MIGRRVFLRWFVGGPVVAAASGFLPFRSARAAEGEQEVRFRWRVDEAHQETVRAILTSGGAVTREEPEQDTKGGWVIVIIGAIALVHLAEAILELRRKMVHGGVVIDTRGGEVKIQKDPAVPADAIVIISKDGENLYDNDEMAESTQLVKALAESLRR